MQSAVTFWRRAYEYAYEIVMKFFHDRITFIPPLAFTFIHCAPSALLIRAAAAAAAAVRALTSLAQSLLEASRMSTDDQLLSITIFQRRDWQSLF